MVSTRSKSRPSSPLEQPERPKSARKSTGKRATRSAARAEEEDRETLDEHLRLEQDQQEVEASGHVTPVREPKTEEPHSSPSRSSRVAQTPMSPIRSPARAIVEEQVAAPAPTAHKHKYEFGGPLGAFFIVASLPFVVTGLYFLCNDSLCVQNPLTFDWTTVWPFIQEHVNKVQLFSKEGFYLCLGWFGWQVLLWWLLPGEVAEGVPLRNGQRLKYTLNGHLAFWVSLLALLHGSITVKEDWSISSFGSFNLAVLYDEYLHLATAAIVISFVLAIYLYVSSFKPGALLADGGNTGNPIYDFFIGRELNPRIGSFDLKEFCELRPGLMGWALLNLGMAFKQYQKFGYVTPSMLLVTLSQGIYVWDAQHMERAILTTMDITTDGFGFMLAFGDLAWVPFVYSLQARYLVDHDPHLTKPVLIAVVLLQFLGFFIFRSANSQKDEFRRDPNGPAVAHLKYMNTQRGTKLLTSGWWGMARKINYTGDWLITLSWCLLCGFDSPIPYFQAIYFAILLIHRAMRDDEMCAAKYGADWQKYKEQVPYLFIPYVI